jgi:GNAT superfamily N-acetyltransferase
MDAVDLAAREHENLIACYALGAGNAANSLLRHDRGIVLFAVPLPIRLFNQVIVEREDAEPGALRDAIGVMRERGAEFVVNLREGADDQWLPLVQALGLVEASPEPWMPGMAAHPLPAPGSVPVPGGHEIRRVTDLPGLRDHMTAGAAGFGMPIEWFETIMGEGTLADPASAVYVGYTDGTPVTAGFGYRTGATIGVYNIATVEAARRRGYAAAMTMRIVDDGAAAGCDAAILQSSDMGYPIYERLGFRTVVRYRAWIDPDRAA